MGVGSVAAGAVAVGAGRVQVKDLSVTVVIVGGSGKFVGGASHD